MLLVGSVATDQTENATTIPAGGFARTQLRGRFDMIVLGSEVLAVADPWQRLIAHTCAAHLVPGGSLSVSASTHAFAEHAASCGFEQVAAQGRQSFWRRTERWTIHDVVAEARDSLDRITAAQLAQAQRSPQPPLVIDIRVPQDRERYGVIPGAVPIARTVLEWRADPTSGFAHDAIGDFDQPLVVVCNEGYSSSLAAATLHRLGFERATDLVGGMAAWLGDRHPIVRADGASDDEPPLPLLESP